jgi:flagellar biosynthesis/type III secretory pathway protein FliH
LSGDQCLIETANAVVDVSLGVQLAALGAALRADLKA